MRKKTEEPEAKNIAAVSIDYDRVLLMPVEDGLELMRLVSQAELMKGYSNHNVEFHDYDSEITFKLMSMQEYREKKMDKIIDPSENSE
jgi:hypothetical protein